MLRIVAQDEAIFFLPATISLILSLAR